MIEGAIRDLEDVYKEHTLHVSWTGDNTGLAVKLNGSLDGVHWFNLAKWNYTSESDVITVNTHYARYVMASAGGTFQPGTTVTAIIASA